MKRILVKKIPLYLFLIAIGLLSLIVYHLKDTAPQARIEKQQAITPRLAESRKISQVRVHDQMLVKPLLLTEVLAESENLKGLKQSLDSEIRLLTQNGTINGASVYVRKLNDGQWISVNNGSRYAPGSVIKIPALITYLKMAEKNPKLMEKQFTMGHRKGVPRQTFNDNPMVPGQKYSAQEVLSRMIINSDNDATRLINESLDIPLFKKLFTDLDIAEPDVHDPEFSIDAYDLSKFLGILYNATYLSRSNSEFALSLLSKSSFTKGIVSGIPSDVKVAHKFGETGNDIEAQLHETAIVYIGNDSYLITIMTKGKNVHMLPDALSGLSRIAYQKMKS